jgi:hypothetical protein
MARYLGDIEWSGSEENLIPTHFEPSIALQNFNKWLNGDDTVVPAKIGVKSKETLLNFEEEAHPNQFYVMTEQKMQGKRTGVVPKLAGHSNYPWITDKVNVISGDEHRGMFNAGFVLDAVVNANGRCWYYALAIALTKIKGSIVHAGIVKRAIMEKLNESLDHPSDRFKTHAYNFMSNEDYTENNNRFAKWFTREIYNVPRLQGEEYREYLRRVMKCILQLEHLLSLKKFYFLVQYFTYEVYEFASGILIEPFLQAYPNVGISVWMLRRDTLLHHVITEPKKDSLPDPP